MASVKDNIFRPSASWLSRAGVVVSYGPEDTMKSMLMEHTRPVGSNVHHSPQSSHAHLMSNQNQTAQSDEYSDDDRVSGYEEGQEEDAVRQSGEEDELEIVDMDNQNERKDLHGKRTVSFGITETIGRYIDYHEDVRRSDDNDQEEYDENDPNGEIAENTEDSGDEDAQGSEYEEEGGPRQGFTPSERVCVGESKTFEQILEEQLQLEEERLRKKAALESQTKSSKPKTQFLRKNQGMKACSLKTKTALESKKKQKQGSKGGGHSELRKDTAGEGMAGSRKMTHKTVHYGNAEGGRDSRRCVGKRATSQEPQLSTGCNLPTKSKSASALDLKPRQSTSEPLTSSSQNWSKEEIQQAEEDEMEEFELLEQYADNSFASSISSVARLDKDGIRERLRKYMKQSPRRRAQQQAAATAVTNSGRTGGPSSFNERVCPTELSSQLSEEEDNTLEDGHYEQMELRSQYPASSKAVWEQESSQQFRQQRPPDSPSSESSAPSTSRPRKVSALTSRFSGLTTHPPPSLAQTPHSEGLQEGRNMGQTQVIPQHQFLVSSRAQRQLFDDWATWEDQRDDDLEVSQPIEVSAKPESPGKPNPILRERVSSCASLASTNERSHSQAAQVSPSKTNQEESAHEAVASMAAQMFPRIQADKSQSQPESNTSVQSSQLRHWVEVLEKEIKRFNNENAALSQLKKEREEALKRLESEVKAFEEHKAKEMKAFDEYRETELRKIKKDKKVFEDYQRALKTMPNKKERDEIEKLREELEEHREETSRKESRWQATNSRLRDRVDKLEEEKLELQSRVRTLEQVRLDLQSQLTKAQQQSQNKNTQKRPSLNSVTQAVSFKRAPTVVASGLTPGDSLNSLATVGHRLPGSTGSVLPQRNNSALIISEKGGQHPRPPSSGSEGSRGNTALRASTASDYYTGEEEGASTGRSVETRASKDGRNINWTTAQIAAMRKTSKETKGELKEDIQHPDGMVEKRYKSGAVDIFYANGSIKEVSPDGKTIIVSLFNGDMKQILADGRVIYHYTEEQTVQTTYPDGIEEILYKDGRKEVVRPGGPREVYFPDGSVRYAHPGGREESVLPNGMVVRCLETGDREILLPNGQREVHSAGCKRRIYPDGTTKTVYPDGRQETRYASGRLRVKDKEGNLIVDKRV